MGSIRLTGGFTLIEMIATVAVLAVLVTVGIPSFQETIEKRRLIGAAEQFYGDLQYARSEAIKRNADVFVNFTASGSNWCYGISTGACDCTATSGSTVCQLSGVTKVVNQDGFRNITMETNNNITSNLTFRPRYWVVMTNNNATQITQGNEGVIKFESGTGGSNEKELKVYVGALGRLKLCSPSGSDNVPGYPLCPAS